MDPSSADTPGAASVAAGFVIGVSGHRDIAEADKAAVNQHLAEILGAVRDRFRNAPVTLVTGLAEGVDTMAADAALKLGIQVNAVLPMPLELYEADFEGAALEKLRALLSDSRVRVRSVPLDDGRTAGEMQDQAKRDIQYQLLADYLTRRSNVLLAVWDGEVNGLPGGTSDVAMRYLTNGSDFVPGEVTRDAAADDACGNVLVWVPTRRESAPGAEVPEGVQYLVSNANYDCYWRHSGVPEPILKRWAGFDAYAAERNSDLGAGLDAYGLAKAGDSAASADPAALDAEFIRADQLARAYQHRSDQMFALFGLLAAGMGLTFLIYAKLLAAKTFLVIYIALFVLGFVGFRYSARRHLHGKHLAYRALAETLRVQFFLILSGAGSEYNLRRILGLTSVDRFDRFEWLHEAIRCAEPLVYFGHCEKGPAIEIVRERWIGDQSGYFTKKLGKLHSQHARLETMKTALLVGSVVGALALILFKKSLLHLEMAGYDGKAWLVFFMGLLPLWAAIWELYQGKMATRELLWQYSNQRRYFSAADREIQQAPTLADGQRIIRDLADKALIEIYLWSVHRYHREHEPPAAG